MDKWQKGIQKDFWHDTTMSSIESDIEPFSYDDALNLVGGFGRFQWFSTIFIILGITSGSNVVYGLTFLTTLPEYECRSYYKGYSSYHWERCGKEQICTNEIEDFEWHVDYSSATSYHNWADPNRMDLTCVNKNLIGFLGSIYFVGFAISAAIVPRMADKYGRKNPYMCSLAVQFVVIILIFLCKNIYVAIFYYLLIGVCAGGRIAVGAMYMNEFIPEKYRLWVTTAMNLTDSTTMLIQAIYYSANRNWLPIHIYALLMCLLSLIGAILLPESPKFYYAKR